MRGEHNKRFIVGVDNKGIIPACAGSTDECEVEEDYYEGSSPHARGARHRPSRCPSSAGDHPRMRGEHRFSAYPRDVVSGIIPACAGSTRDCVFMETRHLWIIPACAGSTSSARPRSLAFLGSSPHARGAPCDECGYIIPDRDHPRMRGEHRLAALCMFAYGGIIPACAGSTLNDLRNYTAFLNSRFGYQGTFTHQRATSAPLLSPKPSRRSMLARVAPSRLRHPEHRRVISSQRPLHQFNPLAVNRLPVGLKRLER